MKPLTKREIRINEVAALLLKGMDRKDILEKCGKRWNLGRGAIDNLIRDAKIVAAEINSKHSAIIEAAEAEALATEAKINVLSKIRKREILKSIVEGEAIKYRTVTFYEYKNGKKKKKTVQMPIEPGFFEILKAIQIDNIMSGDSLPEKRDQNIIPIKGTIIK